MTQVAQPLPANQLPVQQVEKSIADNVLNKIKIFEETGSLQIPKNYSAPNALRAAWLIILETKNLDKKPVLEVCSKESVANALLKMIVLGLNPVKRQCSFIAYGNQLTCQKEYQGTIALAKRHGVKNVYGAAVFKGDVFEFITDPKTGYKIITKHEQTLESIDSGMVIAAYATKEYDNGYSLTEIMTMGQIRKAWEQGPTKGQSPAHKNFPDQMAIKTVIGRLLKPDINSSDDANLFADEDEMPQDQISSNVQHQIEQNSNGANGNAAIGFNDEEVDLETGEVKNNVESGQIEGEAEAEAVDVEPQAQLFNQPAPQPETKARTRKATF